MFDSLLKKLQIFDNIAFDLDGTLYRQEEYDYALFKSYFSTIYKQEKAIEIANRLTEFKKLQPYGYSHTYEDFVTLHPDVNIDINELVSYGRKYHKFEMSDKCLMSEVLKNLRASDKRLSLITNGWHITQTNKIESLGIRDCFHDIVILSPYSKCPMKPDPKILKMLGYQGKTVYLGDQPNDKKFAENGNIEFINIDLNNYV